MDYLGGSNLTQITGTLSEEASQWSEEGMTVKERSKNRDATELTLNMKEGPQTKECR